MTKVQSDKMEEIEFESFLERDIGVVETKIWLASKLVYLGPFG